jgi:hypothetical protein
MSMSPGHDILDGSRYEFGVTPACGSNGLVFSSWFDSRAMHPLVTQ